MNVRFLRLVVCLSLLFLAMPATNAQERSETLAEIYAPVDANQRPRLDERLRLLVGYYRGEQWDKVYDLTYKPYLENELKTKTKEEFIKDKRQIANEAGGGFIIGFVPRTTTGGEDAERRYYIQGCVKARWKGDSGYTWGGVTAHLDNGEWFFTSIGVAVDAHNPLPTCSDLKLD